MRGRARRTGEEVLREVLGVVVGAAVERVEGEEGVVRLEAVVEVVEDEVVLVGRDLVGA